MTRSCRCCRAAEARVNEQGLYAGGFIAYEAAPAFDRALKVRTPISGLPLLWLGLYRRPHRHSDLPDGPAGEATLGEWRPSISAGAYAGAVAAIKDYIAGGETYQVNYTWRLQASFMGEPWALFVRLQQAQRAPYGAFLDLGRFAVCSASPELFFELRGDAIWSRPMKGTAARGRTLAEDDLQRRWLHDSPKDRAENVMIVDMIRNDLGRIAHIGSIEVSHLFEIERYPTVLQMTSTVTARTHAPLAAILQALFPCASITGAPKVRTTQLIAELETTARGVYTGAIGFLAPERQARFNVAIRTAVVDRETGRAEYGVGSGIVWDSEAEAEYRECQVKALVLATPTTDFCLLESLRWSLETGYVLLERHLQRLATSAAYFEYPLDLELVRNRLHGLASTLPSRPHKVRLLVGSDGGVTTEATALSGDERNEPLHVALAAAAVDSADPFLYHKTTKRLAYEQALAAHPTCDDVILWNERGEITESSRANVVVRLGERLITPPLSCGLLAGTYRAELLAKDEIQEGLILVEILETVDAIYLINSVRGWMPAVLA